MSHEITSADTQDKLSAPANDPFNETDPSLGPGSDDLGERVAMAADLAPEDEAEDGRTFADMNLQPEVQKALEDMGYERPMKVQLAVFDPVIAGKDLMVQSRTGTGKTAGFGIPIVQMIDKDSAGAQVLILAPTRELALQVSREIAQISAHKGLLVQPIYGGAPIKPQIDALAAGAQIVVGTPGRVLDHLRRGTLKGSGIRLLVLDECDEMLSMGFQEEIEKIIDFLPAKDSRQTVLFSATIPEEIQRIARRHMTDPEEIHLSTGGISVDAIDHSYYVVTGMARTRDLLAVLRAESPESAIIFCNTREDTNTVAKFLRRQGYDAEAISSDLTQRDRERVMRRMRDRNLHFLVATDVAARGIDISNLSHVINYTFPESPEVYVHRTGRTGRAGKSGVAISLVGPRELGSFYYLKLIYKIRPEERTLPSPEDMSTLLESERYDRVVRLVSEAPKDEYRSLARRVWQSSEGERVVGALLQRLLRRPVEETPEAADEPGAEPGAESEVEAALEVEAEAAPPRERFRDEREHGGEEASEERRGGRRERRRYGERGQRRDERPARAAREEWPARDERPIRDERPEPAAFEPAPERWPESAEEPVGVEAENGDRRRRRRRRRSGRGTEQGFDAALEQVPAQAIDQVVDEYIEPFPEQSGELDEAYEAAEEELVVGAAEEVSGPSYDELDDVDKEFWETWADEKAVRRQTAQARSTGASNGGASNRRTARAAAPSASRASIDDESGARTRDRSGASTRLYVNLGKRENITAAGVRDLLGQGMSAAEADRIGPVALRNTHCYVRVPDDIADKIIETSAGKLYEDREVKVERARR